MIQKYNHIPVSVEAVLLTKENATEVADWCGGHVVDETDLSGDPYVAIFYPTMDGNKRVGEGQYIARSAGGNYLTYSKGFFDAMFNVAPKPPHLPHSHIPGARSI